ncbi:hypothetical protein P9112_005106 [Eukaryota sp. TZLM1-RC]
MSTITEPKKGVELQAEIHRIRITLTGRNASDIEKVCKDVVTGARDKGLKFRGPVRMPTKVLRITTRKTPCGEGSKTWDRYQMRIHKRVIDLFSSTDLVRNLTRVNIVPGVNVEMMIAQD